MSLKLEGDTGKEYEETLKQKPGITIFLQPIAPPAALGLAGFAGSTFITSTWIANWWGGPDSPLVFFPFVGIFGGLAQFIAGIYGFKARDTLVTVINGMWGCFWMAIGILYAFVAVGAVPPHSIDDHFPELGIWFTVLLAFTWSGALAALGRDVILSICLFSLAIGSTIATCLFAFNKTGVHSGIKAAAYFWMLSALMAWWRVTVYLIEEAFGPDHPITKFFPIFMLPKHKSAPLVVPGLGEPGVKRGAPKFLPV